MNDKNILITFILWLGLLVACTPPADPAVTATIPSPELAGTEWILASLNGHSPLPNTRLTLIFSEDEASGFSGCNWYGSSYTASETGSLTIPEVSSTARDCPETEGAVAQESAFQEVLRTAASYHLRDDQLEISNAAGDTTLVFEPKVQFDIDPADLVGKAWQLTVWDGRDLLPDTEITLIFDDAETMSGFAGCRHYNGRYTATDDDIRFPMLSMAESNCTQPDPVLIQEGNFTTALSETTNYQLADGQLILYTDPGAMLRFAPLAETLETPTLALAIPSVIPEPTPTATPLPAPSTVVPPKVNCPDPQIYEMVGMLTKNDADSVYINPVLGIEIVSPNQLCVHEPDYLFDNYGFTLSDPEGEDDSFLTVAWLYQAAPEQLESTVQQTIDSYPELEVNRQVITVDGREGVMLWPLPGTEATTQIYLNANERLYRLIFWSVPLDEQAHLLLDWLRFIEPTQTLDSLNLPAP